MLCFDGSRLRILRENAGVSRERLAVAIGRSYSAVVQYESGALTPPTRVLAHIADTLGVPVDDLFAGEVVA